MAEIGEHKIAALAELRNQLGNQITSGSDLLRVQETRETRVATGLQGLNEQLGGGLPRGQLTEIISPGYSKGGGLVMAELMARARRERQYAVLFDVGRGFTPESFPESDLETLLWVGCESAKQAVEALDIASRDENFQLFLLDLRDCEPTDWSSVRSGQWYRILGQLRPREAVTVIFSRKAVTSAAKHRLSVENTLSIDSLDSERAGLLEQSRFTPMTFPVSTSHDSRKSRSALSIAG